MPKLVPDLAMCFEQGVEARTAGRPLSENPYRRGTAECREWRAGWEATLDLDEDGDPASDRLQKQDDAVAD